MRSGEGVNATGSARSTTTLNRRRYEEITGSIPRTSPQARDGDLIGIGAAVTRRPLPHHRAYGSVHGGSSWLRRHFFEQ